MQSNEFGMGIPQDRCELEPIQFAGCIQPHGVFICADALSREVIAASENNSLVHRFVETPCGKSLGDVWPELDARPQDGTFLTTDGYLVIRNSDANSIYFDIEPCKNADAFSSVSVIDIAEILTELSAQSTLDIVMATLSEKVRLITGMERVLVYRFDKDGHGEVVAESIAGDWNESFHGFHFPAADIPSQARALYLINRLSLIHI